VKRKNSYTVQGRQDIRVETEPVDDVELQIKLPAKWRPDRDG